MPAGGLTYAIGDVHGRADLLLALLRGIHAHRAGRPRRLVLLGDYVDRGPDSARVVEVLRLLQANDPDVVCLAGNHEDMMIRARQDRESWWHWHQNGGDATLASYGTLDVDDVPAADVAWLEALPTLHDDGQRYFVHAGLHPNRPVEPEVRRDRLWIRGDFLDVDHDFGRHVVHGHTPQVAGLPETRPHRTNLDTYAWSTGVLTAGVFTNARAEPVGFLQTTPGGGTRELAVG